MREGKDGRRRGRGSEVRRASDREALTTKRKGVKEGRADNKEERVEGKGGRKDGRVRGNSDKERKGI